MDYKGAAGYLWEAMKMFYIIIVVVISQVYTSILIKLYIKGGSHAVWPVGPLFTDQGINLYHLHWKFRVLTTESPEKSPKLYAFKEVALLEHKLYLNNVKNRIK